MRISLIMMRFTVLAVFLAVAGSCKGPEGSVGPAGTAGPSGPGTRMTFTGNVPAFTQFAYHELPAALTEPPLWDCLRRTSSSEAPVAWVRSSDIHCFVEAPEDGPLRIALGANTQTAAGQPYVIVVIF